MDDKPKLFSLVNRHQIITQVIAGLLILIIVAVAAWIWSELNSSNAAKAVNAALAAAWNWTFTDMPIARWKVLLFSFSFGVLLLVTIRPHFHSAFRSPRAKARTLDLVDSILRDFTRMFGFPRLKLSVVQEEQDEARLLKSDGLERREVHALRALALGEWHNNEAHVGMVAQKLGGNVHVVELALVGLVEKGYANDVYHSGRHWFRLSTHGQDYAVREGILEDLDPPS